MLLQYAVLFLIPYDKVRAGKGDTRFHENKDGTSVFFRFTVSPFAVLLFITVSHPSCTHTTHYYFRYIYLKILQLTRYIYMYSLYFLRYMYLANTNSILNILRPLVIRQHSCALYTLHTFIMYL
jgi:hypothetical protein